MVRTSLWYLDVLLNKIIFTHEHHFSYFVFTRIKKLTLVCHQTTSQSHDFTVTVELLTTVKLQTESEKFPSNCACKDAAVRRRVSVIGRMKLSVWQLLLFSDMLATTFVKTRKHFPTHLCVIYSGITCRRAKSPQLVLNTDFISGIEPKTYWFQDISS